MDYDKILLELGEFGKWQKFNNLMLWIASLAGGMTSVMVIISIMEPSNGFRCRNACDVQEDFHFEDWSPSLMFPSLDPYSASYDESNPDYCTYYASALEDGDCVFDNSTILSCEKNSGFAYADFEMESSLVTANNLVCSNHWKIEMIRDFRSWGSVVGTFIFGLAADRIGRRYTLLIGVLYYCIGNLVSKCMGFQHSHYGDSWCW